jgi:hypothetical protein
MIATVVACLGPVILKETVIQILNCFREEVSIDALSFRDN